ncbi:MAG TPA: helix-turn-helix transcriptional regulator [Micromonospora sp.]
MSTATLSPPALLLDGPASALLAAIEAEPQAPLGVAITAPGGHGKTALLEAIEAVYLRAGSPVVRGPEALARAPQEAVVVVDDAHVLEEACLADVRRRATGGQRVVVAYRPWPRRPALDALAATLTRCGRAVALTPFTPERTAAYLRHLAEGEVPPSTAHVVHTHTAGIPRLVDWLGRSLLSAPTPPTADARSIPHAALAPIGVELDALDSEARRLVIAASADVDMPIDVLGSLFVSAPEALDALLGAVRSTGLVGPDDRLPPMVKHAVVTLTPAAQRLAVWQHVAERLLHRGASVLPLARSLRTLGASGETAGMIFEAAAEEALPRDPALAAELFGAAATTGRATAARQARAAALAGDLDTALRIADRLVTVEDPTQRATGAAIAATALAHRGYLSRSAELHRWSGSISSRAFGAIAAAATGHPEELTTLLTCPPGDGPPTLLAGAALLMARGVRETLAGSLTAALSALVQAAALVEPSGPAVLLPDSPAALAALAAAHCGEFDIGLAVLDRAMAAQTGGPVLARRHRLLRAWLLMLRGQISAAAEEAGQATSLPGRLEPRDLIFATGLEVGLARRTSDLAALHRRWTYARDALVRHPVDLFTLLPLGEFAIAAARLRDHDRLRGYLDEAHALLAQLGDPPLWSVPLRWSLLHAAILAEEPAVAHDQAAALATTAHHSRYAAAIAAAAESWLEILRGVVHVERVEAAARGLHAVGLSWDAARLAGQAAIRTADRKAMTTLLDCARMLQGKPSGAKTGERATDAGALAPAAADSPLSEREREVAELVLAGLTYKQIGDRLFISAKTVEHHVTRIRQRLGCANRGELLARLRAMAAESRSAQS